MTLTPPLPRPPARGWFVHPPASAAVAALSEALSISPVLAQLLVNRGYRDIDAAEDFLHSGHESLFEPVLLDGLEAAADILSDAVRRGRRILVHGDYDADGVSGTALLVAFLRDIGSDAIPYIPHRIDEGYGLSAEAVRHAVENDVHLMVSVDCGSSSPQVVALAHEQGLQVVITDHHMVTTPPAADAFVNPRAPGSTYPFPHLSGAGVAYKLVQAMSERLGCGQPEDHLDLAAIGTVGDVVPLTGENRILVREGLAVMAQGKRPGIVALARVAGLLDADDGGRARRAPLSARDVAFDIAPRINACGRLEHAMQAALLLLETDPDRAEALAREVDALNQQRRELETAVRQEAEARVLARGLEGWNVIVEGSTGWHQGIVGITANRLLDRYGLPSFVISIAEDGTAKGSARAPAHIDLYACLQRCADLFTHFGGHPRAGGFQMRADNIDALRERLQQVVPELASPPEPALRVDLELPLERVDLELVEELDALHPLGQANPAPLFLARGVRIRTPRKIKDRHWKFTAQQGAVSVQCIAFHLVERLPELADGQSFDMIYALEREVFRGEPRISFQVRELVVSGGPADAPRASETVAVEATAPSPPPMSAAAPPPPREGWRVEDARRHPSLGRYLADVVNEGHLVVALCRRDEVGRVTRAAAGAADRPPATLCVVAYGDVPPTLSGMNWILFDPPPSFAALAPLQQASGGRCHVAFSEEDVRRQAGLVAAVDMSTERLREIYRVFKRGCDAEGVLEAARIPRLLEGPGLQALRVESLRVAARIFCEAGVLEKIEGGYRFTERAPDLEASATFRVYRGLAEAFAPVAALFGQDEATMRHELRALLEAGG